MAKKKAAKKTTRRNTQKPEETPSNPESEASDAVDETETTDGENAENAEAADVEGGSEGADTAEDTPSDEAGGDAEGEQGGDEGGPSEADDSVAPEAAPDVTPAPEAELPPAPEKPKTGKEKIQAKKDAQKKPTTSAADVARRRLDGRKAQANNNARPLHARKVSESQMQLDAKADLIKMIGKYAPSLLEGDLGDSLRNQSIADLQRHLRGLMLAGRLNKSTLKKMTEYAKELLPLISIFV